MAIPTPVSAWNFDESSGNADDAVASNNLTNNNTIAYASALINNGADFESGSSQTFSITNAGQTGLDPTGSFSYSTWFKPETSNTETGFAEKWGVQGNRSWSLSKTATTVNFRSVSDGTSPGNAVTESITMSNGTWYHLVFVYNAATPTVKIFVNGSSSGAQAVSQTSIYDSTADVIFGYDGNNYMDGIVDATAFWNVALSDGEVAELYNSGTGVQYPYTIVYNMAADVGAFTLTGIDVGLLRPLIHMVASVGSFTLTGIDVAFNRLYNMVASVGSFILSGIDVALNFSGWSNQSKNSSSFNNQSKNTSVWTNEPKL